MAAPRRLPKQWPGASPPAAPPAWTRPGSSKGREGQGLGWEADPGGGAEGGSLLRVQVGSLALLHIKRGSLVPLWDSTFTQSLLGGSLSEGWNLLRDPNAVIPLSLRPLF